MNIIQFDNLVIEHAYPTSLANLNGVISDRVRAQIEAFIRAYGGTIVILSHMPVSERSSSRLGMQEHHYSLELIELVQELIAEFSHIPLATVQVASMPDVSLPANPLSPRELEILHLMAEGYSNKEIATQLFVCVSTVKKHINHIYDKLDTKNRTQAVARARDLNLLS